MTPPSVGHGPAASPRTTQAACVEMAFSLTPKSGVHYTKTIKKGVLGTQVSAITTNSETLPDFGSLQANFGSRQKVLDSVCSPFSLSFE
jgi:hypothetical protein